MVRPFGGTQIKLTERCYISNNEREYYKNIRLEESKLGDDKVKLAKRQYRGQEKMCIRDRIKGMAAIGHI